MTNWFDNSCGSNHEHFARVHSSYAYVRTYSPEHVHEDAMRDEVVGGDVLVELEGGHDGDGEKHRDQTCQLSTQTTTVTSKYVNMDKTGVS